MAAWEHLRVVTAFALLAVVVVLFAAAALSTRDEPALADAPPDRADVALPEGPVRAEDVPAVRFGMTLRGYRMSQVDAVLDRLAEELRTRDERISVLEQERSGS